MVRPGFEIVHASGRGNLLIVNVHVRGDVLTEDKRAMLQVVVLSRRVCHVGLERSVEARP